MDLEITEPTSPRVFLPCQVMYMAPGGGIAGSTVDDTAGAIRAACETKAGHLSIEEQWGVDAAILTVLGAN